ncbi:MAG: hypothetical protein KAS04_01415 [Candidatus Aenigmarchaeota archaeon]|nr:hypothetical protein [Candidatus Aenigmarchaeota archaeon]
MSNVCENIFADVVRIDKYRDGSGADVWFKYNGKEFAETYSSDRLNFEEGDKVCVSVFEGKLKELTRESVKTEKEMLKEMKKYCEKTCTPGSQPDSCNIGIGVHYCNGPTNDNQLDILPKNVKDAYMEFEFERAAILGEDSE